MEYLLDYFTPSKYNLTLRIERDTERISGTVEIAGRSHCHQIKLDAVNMEISEVELAGQKAEFTYKDNIIDITLPDAVDQETEQTVKVKFTTQLSHNMMGCYLSTYQYKGKEERIVATQFESHYAREAFPCIDEPAAKAEFNLTLEIPDFREDLDIVLANTPLASRSGNRFVFEPTPKMSTYLLAWVVGAFHSVKSKENGLEVATYAPLNHDIRALDFPNEVAARAIAYYNQRFNTPYPLPKLDQVALPDFEAGAMENWGLVTYRESMLLAEPEAAIDTKESVALTITHELSHQWFGNLVTMKWWDDLWLNESFATIMEYYCTDALYPEFHSWEGFYTSYCLAALRRDSLQGVQAVQQDVHSPAEIATLFDSAIVYAKGARLVLMLMRLMGEGKFDQGLHDYFAKHKYQNTVADNLWSALRPYADFDVKKFMHAWISQPGYPMISGDKQQRFLLDGQTDDSKWPLPEVLDDMSGHYLVNLSDDDFSKKLQQFNVLSLEQKLRLLIDRELLAKTPAVASASLLDLIAEFKAETSPAVLGVLSGLISDLKLFCPDGSQAETNYKAFLARQFAPRFTMISYQKLEDYDEIQVRNFLTSIAIYVRDAGVIKNLANLYQDDFAKIDAELRSSVFIAKFLTDEAVILPRFLEAYRSEANPSIRADLLYVMAAFAEDSAGTLKVLSLLERPEIVRPQDHLFLFAYLLRNQHTRERALDWLYQSWDYVQRMTGEKSIEDYPRYAAAQIRTDEEADKFYRFFDPLRDQPVLTRTIQMAHTEIDARLELIKRDIEAVIVKLQEK